MVGSWRISVEIPGGPAGLENLAILSSDGTMMVAFPSPTPAAPGASHRLEYWTPAIGSWEARGAHGAAMAFVALGVDEQGAPVGTHAIRATATADDAGQGWQGPFTIEIADAGGKVVATVSGTVKAARVMGRG
jgi:hypothetical protein